MLAHSMVLHKSSPRPDLAHCFIDFMLEGRNSAELTNHIGPGNPTRNALRHIDPAIAAQPGCFPPPAVERRLVMLKDLDRTQRRVMSPYGGREQGAVSVGNFYIPGGSINPLNNPTCLYMIYVIDK